MEIVVCHLTRMEIGYVCAAGLDLETKRHVRAVSPDGRLTTRYLAINQGPFDIGAIVALAATRPVVQQPHVEDHIVDPRRLVVKRNASAGQFWGLLDGASETSLTALFGEEIRAWGRSRYGLPMGRGNASLGLLRLVTKPRLYLSKDSGLGKARIRLKFGAGDDVVDAGVTDIRLYQDNLVIPDETKCRTLAAIIRDSKSIILSLGLTRAFASSPDREPIHWLQVNNIHVAENPVWRLGSR